MELSVGQQSLHYCLAIIETPVHSHGMDVLAQSRHLTLLETADLPFRIEYGHIDTVHLVEAIGHGAAGVAGSGGNDIDRLALVGQTAHHLPHEAGADILECESRPMEKFQSLKPRPDLRKRDIEGECPGSHLQQFLAGIFIEEERREVGSHLRESAIGHRLVKVDGRDGLRHEQTAVGSKPHDGSLLEGTAEVLVSCTVEFHL